MGRHSEPSGLFGFWQPPEPLHWLKVHVLASAQSVSAGVPAGALLGVHVPLPLQVSAAVHSVAVGSPQGVPPGEVGF
jgi:hypothetical protein